MYEGYGLLLWQIPRPPSSIYCRPINIQFAYETVDMAIQEMVNTENQIEKLQPSSVRYNDSELVMVKHIIMMFTMVDGKVCNAITSTKSAMRCYICGAAAKDINTIDKTLEIKKNDLSLKFCTHGYDFLSVCYIFIIRNQYHKVASAWRRR